MESQILSFPFPSSFLSSLLHFSPSHFWGHSISTPSLSRHGISFPIFSKIWALFGIYSSLYCCIFFPPLFPVRETCFQYFVCVCVCVCVCGVMVGNLPVREKSGRGIEGEAPSILLITHSFTGSRLKQTNPSCSYSFHINKTPPPSPELGKFKVQ